ncbi:hypothetical protein PSP6_270126 [Paraburkholderia tropica]|nr:hypothetical protein PSP6_270126 [Paraburkholderia tropica]
MKTLRWLHDNLFHFVMVPVFAVAYGVIALGVAQSLGIPIPR